MFPEWKNCLNSILWCTSIIQIIVVCVLVFGNVFRTIYNNYIVFISCYLYIFILLPAALFVWLNFNFFFFVLFWPCNEHCQNICHPGLHFYFRFSFGLCRSIFRNLQLLFYIMFFYSFRCNRRSEPLNYHWNVLATKPRRSRALTLGMKCTSWQSSFVRQ